MQALGRSLVIAGGVIAAAGLFLMFTGRIPFLGRLPGDIEIKKENFRLYIPLATSLLISVLVTAAVWLIQFLRKR